MFARLLYSMVKPIWRLGTVKRNESRESQEEKDSRWVLFV